MRLTGRNAIVTGAGSGIGRATALAFASEGASVACFDISEEAAGETAAAIVELHGVAQAFTCDVSVEHEVRYAVEAATDAFGPIHVLFNNAGIAVRRTVTDEQPETWDKAMAVNVRGIYLTSKFVIPHMPHGSSITNTASVTGLTGVRNRAVYSATKGAIIALTRNMALDYAPRGLRVNCVCPGFVRTPLLDKLLANPERARALTSLHPLGRLGTPEDVANAVVFLVSDEASWITGHALAVDGGFAAGHSADI